MLKQSIPWKKVPINALLRRFAHLMLKKDVSCPETKKDLLRKVKNAISSTAERFSGNMQNDAHEFLSQCLDQLKDDVEKMNKSLTSDAAASYSVVRDNSSEAMLSAFKVEPGEEADTSRLYTCPVAVNMEFEVQHTITCKCCGEVVTKREQFNDLSIDLPRRKKTLPLRSIQDSLDLFFRMEEIEYSCEKCYGKSATVAHKFSKLPRVLILHLKRYSFNAQLSLNSKLGQQPRLDDPSFLVRHKHTDVPPSIMRSICVTANLSIAGGDLLETGKKPADVLDSLDLTMDENKENQTPECLQQQGELDWVQQYNLDQEREEQELQQALAQSLQEHEAQELREDDDLKRATELSLQGMKKNVHLFISQNVDILVPHNPLLL
uniref:Ubiquitin specific peptidase 37 n=1 Tax=Nothobranchius furzeri TaxID=105023 RepID=A0A1A8B5Y0_NOTFU